jgi:hypothetical protein
MTFHVKAGISRIFEAYFLLGRVPRHLLRRMPGAGLSAIIFLPLHGQKG